MSPSLFTITQARWGLDLFVGVLSGVAVASSAPSAAGGAEMYSGRPGDIRGLIVLMGSTGLVGVAALRMAHILLSRPWRLYLDRLEFTLVSMLWICWTSATMAFSAFTLQQGVCSPTLPEFLLPTCPLLTFDLTLLHLLSTSTLALLLVIISSTLSPSYFESLSLSEGQTVGKGSRGYIMWEMALGSVPNSPTRVNQSLPPDIGQTTPESLVSYGTLSPTTPRNSTWSYAQGMADAEPTMPSSSASEPWQSPPKKKDRYAEGRVWTYLPLFLCSLGVACASMIGLGIGDSNLSEIFMFVISVLSMIFTILCLKSTASADDIKRQAGYSRQVRAFEVATAAIFFLLWPLAAVLFTLFPDIPYRPCSNPASSAAPSPREDADPEDSAIQCYASWTIITLAWTASWIILKRIMGLIFPMPEVKSLVSEQRSGDREEAALLGQNKGKKAATVDAEPVDRPRYGWGRVVAGEAFELGEDEEDEEAY
ncbi:hypothetical protein CNJ01775 [Cryptococcus deneoformans JEC21]|uniref:Uncharacterized protein n=1 Tax=Cryptococcus deneoformans (strain JEC21 / ATCC MYA-565) TaxID=214684 RepID=A0A0S2LIW9_CRYD1|nr:hypothetical protein CNJ01775 [Cryptococcus neoformans var. neoformans JEC21]ALO60908.1 hypothetical protein CNJ01775 [Cryptococcus neoformans var. neoformans JEC21]